MSAEARARLERAAAQCQAADDPDLVWLGQQLVAELEHPGEPGNLAHELGLDWHARLAYRDEKIREAGRYFTDSGYSIAAAAGAIASLAAALQRRRSVGDLDHPLAGGARGVVAEGLGANVGFPKKRQIISILTALAEPRSGRG